jgi:glycine/D-amino acid oxidase-like deaminating enzyme
LRPQVELCEPNIATCARVTRSGEADGLPYGRLYAHTCVTSVEEHEDGVLVRTVSGHDVRADAAVVATNSPINDRVAIHTKQAPYRTYAMAFTVPRESFEDGLYWDTLDPYHYVRLEPGRGSYDYLIVGGGDHKTGQADDAAIRFQALEAWARNMVPRLGKETHRWSGQIMDTMDYAGFIGRNPGSDNVYVATGDSGQGITHGVVSGLLNSTAQTCPRPEPSAFSERFVKVSPGYPAAPMRRQCTRSSISLA